MVLVRYRPAREHPRTRTIRMTTPSATRKASLRQRANRAPRGYVAPQEAAHAVTIAPMYPGPYAEFSFVTLVVLLGVLGLSSLTFWLLVRRATSHRTWVALSDWAKARAFRYHPIGDGEPPEPFSVMPGKRPSVRLWLMGKRAELLELSAPNAGTPASAGAGANPAPAEPGAPRGESVEVSSVPAWHVLIRQVE